MAFRLSDSKLISALGSLRAQPQLDWQEGMLRKLSALSAEESPLHGDNEPSWVIRILLRWALPACALIAIIGTMYWEWPQTGSTAYAKHIATARGALTEIKNFVDGSEVALASVQLFPSVSAAEEQGEERIGNLVLIVRKETKAALEEALRLPDPQVGVAALVEITALQRETLDIVSDALLKLQEDAVVGKITLALEETAHEIALAEGNALVALADRTPEVPAAAKETLDLAMEADQVAPVAQATIKAPAHPKAVSNSLAMHAKQPVPEPESEADEQQFTQIWAAVPSDVDTETALPREVEEARQLLNISVGAEGNLTVKTREKRARVETLLRACEEQNGRCEARKAKGVAIAVNARVRIELQQRENEQEAAEEKSETGANVEAIDKEASTESPMDIDLGSKKSE